MPRYAQWLDGAYISLAASSLNIKRKDSLHEGLTSRLKLHALFGHEFALSDIQTVDSSVVHSLFNDESFLSFLRRHPTFLSLVARPANPANPNRWSIVRMGLQRTQNPVWTSSSFPSPEIPRALAQEILEAAEYDATWWLVDRASPLWKVVKRWPHEESALKGIVKCIAHFDSPTTPYSAPEIQRSRTLYEVLRSTREDPRVSTLHQRLIDTTLKFIDGEIEEDKRGMQSVVFSELDRKVSALNPEYYVIKHTTHHAWNTAVMETVSPESGSLGHLPWGAHSGMYLNRITDVIFPARDKKGRVSIPVQQGHGPLIMDWDPGRLDWSQVAEIREQTSTSALAVQRALSLDDPYYTRKAIEAHLRALTDVLAEKPPPLLHPLVWIIGSVALLIIDPRLAGYVIMGERVVEEGWRELVYRGRRYRVANTLRRFSRETGP